MLVRDAMGQTPATVNKEDSLRNVVKKMIMTGTGTVCVTEEDNTLVGIVTIRDVMLPLYPNQGDYVHDNVHARDFQEMEDGYAQVLELKAKEVMTPNPMTVELDTPALKAASFMGLKNLRRIPVCDQGKLAGLLSITDINTAMFLKHAGDHA